MTYKNALKKLEELYENISSGADQKQRKAKMKALGARMRAERDSSMDQESVLETPAGVAAQYFLKIREQNQQKKMQGNPDMDGIVTRTVTKSSAGGGQRPQRFADAAGANVGYRLVKDLQEELGISREAAAGIVGNLHHETGGFKFMQEIDPVVEGSRGGYGFAQWTGPRRKQFEAWAAENNLDINSYEANKGFLIHELTSTKEGKVLEQLHDVSAEDAAKIFSDVFLRPGVKATNRRVGYAQQYARDV